MANKLLRSEVDKLTKAKKRYSVTRKELLVLAYSLKHLKTPGGSPYRSPGSPMISLIYELQRTGCEMARAPGRV